MATTGVRSLFVDTNVLVYATIATAPFHVQALTTLQNWWNSPTDLWISRQVVREFVVNLTRPQTFSPALSISVVTQQVHYLKTRFRVADDTDDVTDELLNLLSVVPTGGKQVHDANIVATMKVYGITHLLTHNTADFTRYSSYVTVIPL